MAKVKTETIEYYQNLAKEMILANEGEHGRNEMYRQIDQMIACDYTLPSELTDLEWIGNRKFVSNAPRNAAQAATRTFAALLPKINIDPLSSEEGEWERVNKMETAFEWHLKQLNIGRKQSPHWKIVENAVNYCNVSLQTEYLPYAKKKQKGKRVQAIKRRGDFNFIVHHPSNVHSRFSDDMLECVVLCYSRTVQDLINQFGAKNPGVAELLEELDSDKKEKGADRYSTYVYFYDFTDYDNRVIWAVMTDNGKMGNACTGYAYEIMREPHKLSFLPWVVKDNKEPILKTVYDTWVNINIIKSIIFAKHVQLAGHPTYWTKKVSPSDDVNIETDSPSNKLDLLQGQEAGVLPPPPIDPQLAKTEADLDSQIYQSSAASVLGSVEKFAGANTPFSSINAVLQAALGQLGLAKLTAEQAYVEALHQIARWIDFSGEPLMAYRSVTKDQDRDDMKAGAQYALMPGEAPEDTVDSNVIYFDPDELYINVELQAQSITDDQGRIANAINKTTHLGFSQQEVYEEAGGNNFDISQEQWASEVLFKNKIQIQVEREAMELRIEEAARMQEIQLAGQERAMQSQMQMEQQMSPENQTQQNRSQGAFAASQGMDTRAGNANATMPGMGREQITGTDANGNQLA